jgi:hypothetical protein
MGVTVGLAVLMKVPEIHAQSNESNAQGKGENSQTVERRDCMGYEAETP